jgi:hypothetical protein
MMSSAFLTFIDSRQMQVVKIVYVLGELWLPEQSKLGDSASFAEIRFCLLTLFLHVCGNIKRVQRNVLFCLRFWGKM